jgi:hypothetical protein
MSRILRHLPSPAMIVACLALAVALAGTSYAAGRLPANSVGTKQLKKNAVTSAKVKNDALTGADVKEGTLGQVPSAATAANATNAGHAASADSAATANAAFGTYNDSQIPLPTDLGAIGTLSIPAAGNYVVFAKLEAYNASGTPNTRSRCYLRGGTGGADLDGVAFDVDAAFVDDEEVVSLQGVLQLTSPGQAALVCADYGEGAVQASLTKIMAVQVAQLTNTRY